MMSELTSQLNMLQIVLLLIAVILLGTGFYYIVTEFLILPDNKARKAISSYGKGKKAPSSDEIISYLASKIERYIVIEENQKKLLQRKLNAAELDHTPEFHTARAVASGLIVTLFGVVFALIFSAFVNWMIIFSLFVILGIFSGFKMMNETNEIISRKAGAIEPELALFASTIQKQLSSTTDIIKIFESYRKICGEAFRHEIDVTIADMKTGSYEIALLNFDNRVRLESLSQIIRGLIAVLKGDDQRVYFDMLVHDLSNAERERLKRLSLKRPSKLNFSSAMVLVCFITIIVYIIGFQIIREINGIL